MVDIFCLLEFYFWSEKYFSSIKGKNKKKGFFCIEKILNSDNVIFEILEIYIMKNVNIFVDMICC